MITTTKQINAMKCDICAIVLKPEKSPDVPSVPALFGGRICCDCDHKFKRSTIPSSGQTPVEKDYKAFLDGKREYAITVRNQFAYLGQSRQKFSNVIALDKPK